MCGGGAHVAWRWWRWVSPFLESLEVLGVLGLRLVRRCVFSLGGALLFSAVCFFRGGVSFLLAGAEALAVVAVVPSVRLAARAEAF